MTYCYIVALQDVSMPWFFFFFFIAALRFSDGIFVWGPAIKKEVSFEMNKKKPKQELIEIYSKWIRICSNSM